MKNNFERKKQEKLKKFDPNGVFLKNRLFGLPFSEEESRVIIIPIPWEATVSFREGTASAPRAVLSASSQIDIFDQDFPDAWKNGIFMQPVSSQWEKLNKKNRTKARKLIEYLENGKTLPKNSQQLKSWKEIDQTIEILHRKIEKEAGKLLKKKKMVGILGGDHSVSLGLIKALSKIHPSFGILQIDAHLDLRDSYEGFCYSHASAMRRAIEIKEVSKIVNVGARDYSQEENDFIRNSKGRCQIFSSRTLEEKIFSGKSWENICQEIIKTLPEKVYISFDIDGLNSSFCPNTGTPVPGGLGFEQAFYLLKQIKKSRRQIVGFDLCEVAPASRDPKSFSGDWNAIVGSHALYRLSIIAGSF